jgi:hypothetical protein
MSRIGERGLQAEPPASITEEEPEPTGRFRLPMNRAARYDADAQQQRYGAAGSRSRGRNPIIGNALRLLPPAILCRR